MTQPQSDLVDQIYEAAFVPQMWDSVLHRMGTMCDGVGTVLFTLHTNDLKWMASPGIKDAMVEFVVDWAHRNTRSARVLQKRHPGFLGELDIYTEEELNREPMYSEFLRPRGLGWGAASIVPVSTGDMLIFSMERSFKRGPVEKKYVDQLDALRPHLARAALFSARLRLERAKAAADALQLIGLAAAVIGKGARVLAANAMFEDAQSQVAIGASDRLSLVNQPANAMLLRVLEQLEAPGGTPHAQSIPLLATAQAAPAILHLLPVRGSAHDIFAGGMTLLIITPTTAKATVPVEALETLFDLTPAEARVARGIGAGQTIETIAAALGVSRETIRNQLKAVFGKTGINRQAELIGLLSSISLPNAP